MKKIMKTDNLIPRLFFPETPRTRWRREKQQLLLTLSLGLMAALGFGVLLYLVQDRLNNF